MNETAFTRRLFMQRSLTMVSTCATLPLFIQRSAFGIDNPFEYRATSSRPGVPEDRVLVVVQLGGGNDGLNTVVPYGMRAYYDARPQLAVGADDALKFADGKVDGIGLHPSLAPLMDLYDDGALALYQGVGYPNPNRSHFKSMDIWHTANPAGDGQGSGWIGRYFDHACAGEPEPNLSVSVGQRAPLAMQGSKVQPIAFEDANLFKWSGAALHPDVAAEYDRLNRAGVSAGVGEETPAGFLMRTALDAQVSSEKIRAATRARSEVSYPGTSLGRSLRMVAQMIRHGLGTRVYYTDMGGFDTHAGQSFRHGQLLGQFAGAVKAFYDDLSAQGNAARVVVMTFSEFGRRVKQNASGGTDHGTAAPMFIVGKDIRPGVFGGHPSLTKLDDNGDLVYGIDFRSVYASVLEQWMGADADAILGERFARVPLMGS